ncbi:MAG: hypothetical protein WAK13_11115 [Terriglobales bacterium]
MLIASIALAQAPTNSKTQEPTQGTQNPATEMVKKPVEAFNLLDERSIVFPDIAASTTPLSPGQKFELFVDNSVSVHTVLWSALGSAVGQADNSPTGFGQGWNAYGKRFGSSMARGASGEFFGTFILASALHYDPRFFPDRDPTFGHAIKYSVKRVFISRNDAGERVVDIPGLVGPLLGESLANAYWPDRNRTVGDTFFRYGLDLATRAGGNMLREYWPVVYRKITHTSPTGAAR